MYGVCYLLLISVVVIGVVILFGIVFGLCVGFVCGWFDELIMCVFDVVFVFFDLLFVLMLILFIGFGVVNFVFVFGIVLVLCFVCVVWV